MVTDCRLCLMTAWRESWIFLRVCSARFLNRSRTRLISGAWASTNLACCAGPMVLTLRRMPCMRDCESRQLLLFESPRRYQACSSAALDSWCSMPEQIICLTNSEITCYAKIIERSGLTKEQVFQLISLALTTCLKSTSSESKCAVPHCILAHSAPRNLSSSLVPLVSRTR